MATSPAAIHILLIGAPYSRNTGDGVIADCLAWELTRILPNASIGHVDLAGRTGVGVTAVRNRTLILKVLEYLPKPIRRQVTRVGLTALTSRLRSAWRNEIAGANLVLFSGGQIFSDANLNFPMKIGTVADLCREARKPIATVAVGASKNWSREGRALFQKLGDCDLRCVGLRDLASMTAWQTQFTGGPTPRLVYDPGLLAAGCYGLSPPSDLERAPIGLGISAPMILAHHADRPIAGGGYPMSRSRLFAFFRDLSLTLIQRGHRLRLFCNGAEEDAEALKRLARYPEMAEAIRAGQIEVAPVPDTGAALAREIALCRAVIAHRLHACILGYAFGLPIIGLSWDSKLNAFFEMVGLGANMMNEREIPIAVAANHIEAAIYSRVSVEQHAAVLADCSAGIAAVVSACSFASN